MSRDKDLKELTTLWAVLMGSCFALLGVVFLFLAAKVQFFIDHPGTQSVLRSLAGFLIVSVTLAFLWQVVGKRAFLNEIMTKARLSEEVRRAGVLRVGMDYLNEVNWHEMLNGTKKLDILFAYGYSWRRHNLQDLRELAKGSCRVRVMLPDPQNEDLVSHLAAQFNTQPESLKIKILEAKAEFDYIFGKARGVDYSVWFLDEHPAFTYYRVDNVAVIVFYSHRRPYERPPFLKVESDGSFYQFFREEFRFLLHGNQDLKIPAPAHKVAIESSEAVVFSGQSQEQ